MFGKTNILILKVTRDCNLRCKYCYIKNKDIVTSVKNLNKKQLIFEADKDDTSVLDENQLMM